MKALVFSDSHGRTENLVKAMDRHPDFQAIFHLGDVGNDEAYIRSLTPYPVYMVRGNCDFSSSLKESMVIEFGVLLAGIIMAVASTGVFNAILALF